MEVVVAEAVEGSEAAKAGDWVEAAGEAAAGLPNIGRRSGCVR